MVLIIGQQGIFGPTQIVAVDDGILRDGGAIAAGAAEIGIVAAVVIVLTIGIAAQVVLVIIVIIDLDHHIIDGGAINIQPADGILVLLLHGQRIFQHGLLQLLEDLLLGGLIGIGVIRIGGGSGIAGIGRIGGVAGGPLPQAAKANTMQSASSRASRRVVVFIMFLVPFLVNWPRRGLCSASFYTMAAALVNERAGRTGDFAKKFGFCLQIGEK